jgi:predicted nucleic acid-binding protein
MNCFPDTSFLCSVYRSQEHSPRADAFLAKRTGSIPVSSLLLLEFRQSLRLQVRLHATDKTKGFARYVADQMRDDLVSDLQTKVFEKVDVDWEAVHQKAEELSERYTEAKGHRLVDVLHVATALHLGATEFLTFDANQTKLAKAEGMKVPV